MADKIQLRRDTAARWTSFNPLLASGEPGIETDTGLCKYGDGVNRWNNLKYTDINHKIKTEAGGASSSAPTILKPGPINRTASMDNVSGWFVNGTNATPPVATGTPWEAKQGFLNSNWWSGTEWSLGASAPLPDNSARAIQWVAGTYVKGDLVTGDDGLVYKVKVTSTTQTPNSSSTDWEPVGKPTPIDVAGGAASYESVKTLTDNTSTGPTTLGSDRAVYSIDGYVNSAGNFVSDTSGDTRRTDYRRVFKGDKVTATGRTSVYLIRAYDLNKEPVGGLQSGTVISASIQRGTYEVLQDGYVVMSTGINGQAPSYDSSNFYIVTKRFMPFNLFGQSNGVAEYNTLQNIVVNTGFNRVNGSDNLMYNILGYVQPNGILTDNPSNATFRRTGFIRVLAGDVINVRTTQDMAAIPFYDDFFTLSDSSILVGTPVSDPQGSYQVATLTAPTNGYIICSAKTGGRPENFAFHYFEIKQGVFAPKLSANLNGGFARHETVDLMRDYSRTMIKKVTANRVHPSYATGGVVSFIDDDGSSQVYSYLAPYLRSQGLSMGSAIVTGWIQNKRWTYDIGGGKLNPIMTLTELWELAQYRDNFEIMNHTDIHGFFNDTKTDPQLRAVMDNSNTWFERNFKTVPQGLVYPSGQRSERSIRIGSFYHRCAYTTVAGLNAIGNIKNYEIKRCDFGDPAVSGITLAQMKAYVDQAIATNSWLVICTHVNGYNRYDNWRADFEELVTYIKASSIKCLLPSEAFNVFGNVMETDNGKTIDANLVSHSS